MENLFYVKAFAQTSFFMVSLGDGVMRQSLIYRMRVLHDYLHVWFI